MGGVKAHYDGVKAFSETDFKEDLKSVDIPVLVLHGEDDQIIPVRQGRALFELAKLNRPKNFPAIEYVEYEKRHGLGHFIAKHDSFSSLMKYFFSYILF